MGCLLIYGLMAVYFGLNGYPKHRTALSELFIWCMVLSLVWLYLAGMRYLQESGPVQFKVIVGLGAMAALVAAAIPPFNSLDIFAYTNAGWLQAHYGLNPYVTVASEVPGWQADAGFSPSFASSPFMYGFVFAWICKWICCMGHGSLAFTVILFKIANRSPSARSPAALCRGKGVETRKAGCDGLSVPLEPLHPAPYSCQRA